MIVSVQASLIKLAGVSTAVSTLLAAGNAQAAQEVAALAARDNRASTLLLLLAPALGWVAFNILSPALNQLKGMQNAKRSAAIGLGLGAAAFLSAQNADAAEEIAQVRCVADCITCWCCWLDQQSAHISLLLQLAAGRDNRVFIIATLFVPVVGWVGFNILGPALNQLQAQVQKNTNLPAGKGKGKGARR